MEVYPIGIVRNWAEGKHADNTTQIEICDQFSAGLKDVEKADSLWIMFWMHKLSDTDREVLHVHPRGDVTREKRGVFALRI